MAPGVPITIGDYHDIGVCVSCLSKLKCVILNTYLKEKVENMELFAASFCNVTAWRVMQKWIWKIHGSENAPPHFKS